MNNPRDKVYLNWGDIEKLVDNICNQIVRENPPIKTIRGIPRGGLIPATLISHKLNIPYNVFINDKYTLLVDDICDTGKTLKEQIGFEIGYTATLHYKPTAVYKPSFYGGEIGSEWLVYPWERKDSNSIQDYLV
jgi:hypoxanthine phosphoribosyltransferase